MFKNSDKNFNKTHYTIEYLLYGKKSEEGVGVERSTNCYDSNQGLEI